MLELKTSFALQGLQRLQQLLPKEGANPASSIVIDGFRKCVKIYLDFLLNRFRVYSGGGGDWAPLSQATILNRLRKMLKGREAAIEEEEGLDKLSRKRRLAAVKGVRTKMKNRMAKGDRLSGIFPILRDTNTLYNTLVSAANDGGESAMQWIDGGARVAPTGLGAYKSGIEVGQVAFFHQTGTERMPARKIVVPPDSTTEQAILREVVLCIMKLYLTKV